MGYLLLQLLGLHEAGSQFGCNPPCKMNSEAAPEVDAGADAIAATGVVSACIRRPTEPSVARYANPSPARLFRLSSFLVTDAL